MMKTYRTIWYILFSFLSSFALHAQNEADILYSTEIYEYTGRENKMPDEIVPEFDSLQAIIGSGNYCLGDEAIVPVLVNNFNSVASFQLKFNYYPDILLCQGFGNVHPQLTSNFTAMIDMGNGVITLQWHDMPSVTFTQMDTVCELLFTPKQTGQSQINWSTGPAESYFINADGSPIPAKFLNGEVNIYDPPVILLSSSKTVCNGETVTITGIASSSNPPISYQWTYPDGTITSSDPFFASVTRADSGNYTLLATDAVGCTDQKSIHLIVSCQSITENNTSGMMIYPNPGNGLFEVRIYAYEDITADVKVTDASGTVVYQKDEVVFPATGQICINLSNFADGVYFLEVNTKEGVLKEKLILRHN